jgi:signal transduction histidine kinase
MDRNGKKMESLERELERVQLDLQLLKSLYQKELADRKQAEELLVRQNDIQALVNQFSVDMASLSADQSLEALVIKRLKEVSGARIVMLSSYYPDTRTLATDYVEAEPGLLSSFINLVGKGHKHQFDVSDEMYAYLSGEVVGVRTSLHEISFGSIPKPLSSAIQALLKVNRFIGLAFFIEGRLYGTALLGMSRDKPDPPKPLMESFAFITSVSLRRKQAEEALKISYDMLNNLLRQVPGVVYQYRLYPDGRSAFPFASQGMFDIYEVTPEEVREDASLVFTRLHPDDYDMIVETITESARSQTFYESEFRVILPSQGVRWRRCNAKPTLLEDGSTLWYGIIFDITDRKMVENELIRAKEKAEESDRLKSAFLANISHEIRTPMNGILGFAELLGEPDLTGEQQREYVKIIEKSGERMLNIINDIIDISKIESGQMEVHLSQTNINEQVDFIYEFFKPEVERKGMQIIALKGLPAKDAVMKTDREKVYAILTNFVKNAIKFTHQGSIVFGYDLVDHQLQFFVKDTGPGIPIDRQAAIFERFVQADLAHKQALQGAGLGLSISKAYVHMLGGKIWVVSVPGNGAAFYFTIPCVS